MGGFLRLQFMPFSTQTQTDELDVVSGSWTVKVTLEKHPLYLDFMTMHAAPCHSCLLWHHSCEAEQLMTQRRSDALWGRRSMCFKWVCLLQVKHFKIHFLLSEFRCCSVPLKEEMSSNSAVAVVSVHWLLLQSFIYSIRLPNSHNMVRFVLFLLFLEIVMIINGF